QRRFALDVHVVFVIVHLEYGFGGVHDLPHDYGGDLDGIAVGVVDLELRRFEVAHAQADGTLGEERVGPAQTGFARGAGVAAEQLQHHALVRLHLEKALAQEGDDHEHRCAHGNGG